MSPRRGHQHTPAGVHRPGPFHLSPSAPPAHRPYSGGGQDDPDDSASVVWLAYGWDMSEIAIRRLAGEALDLGAAVTLEQSWELVASDGDLAANNDADPGQRLWGRLWLLPRRSAQQLAHARLPNGHLDTDVAVLNDSGARTSAWTVILEGPPDPCAPRLSPERLGVAFAGAREAGLPQTWQMTVEGRESERSHLPRILNRLMRVCG